MLLYAYIYIYIIQMIIIYTYSKTLLLINGSEVEKHPIYERHRRVKNRRVMHPSGSIASTFGELGLSFFMAGAVFGEVRVALFVAGAVFGDLGLSLLWQVQSLGDSRHTKRCVFQ